MRKFITLFLVISLAFQLKSQDCATWTEGCISDAVYEWVVTLAPGAALDFGTLTPANAWTITQIGTNPEVWSIQTFDPDPANPLVFSLGEWSAIGLACDQVNIQGDAECVLDDCLNCSSVQTCEITAGIPTNIQCMDNGTPGDPSDDTFTFDLLVNEPLGSTSWNADDPLNSSGTYGTVVTMGPYAISGGALTITITDSNDPTCTDQVQVSPPNPCSNSTSCILTIDSVIEGACNDNGTPFNIIDDYFEVFVNATATDGGLSNQFTVSTGVSTFGPFQYGIGGNITVPSDGMDYTLTFTDADDPLCVETRVISNEPCCQVDLETTVIPVTNNMLDDGEIQICINSGIAPYNIEISPTQGSIYEAPGTCSSNFVIAGLAQGDYEVTITDGDGCVTVVSNQTISGPDCTGFQLSDVIANPVSCNGSTDGTIEVNLYDEGEASSITVEVGNGVPPVTFTDLDGTLVVENVPPGQYDVALFDNNGCEVTFLFNPVVVSEPDPITYEATVGNATTIGGEDGSILLCLDGGNGGFTAVIEPDTGMVVLNAPGCLSGSGILLEDLPADNYTVTIADQNGCPMVLDFIVNDPTCPLELVLDDTTHVECGGDNTGAMTVTVVGSTPPVSISLNGGITFLPSQTDTTFVIENLLAGDYGSIIVADNLGCWTTFDNPIEIEETPIITLDPGITHVSTFGGDDGNIFMCLNGGVPPYDVSVSPNIGNLIMDFPQEECMGTYNLSVAEAGIYEITVTDELNCSQVFTVEVLEPTCPGFTAGELEVTDITCYGANNGSVTITMNGGTPPYTYTLSGIQPVDTMSNTYTFEGLDEGVYDLMITDAAGCFVPYPTTLEVAEPRALFSTISSIPPCVGEDNGVICLTPEEGTPGYSYNIFNEDGDEMTVEQGPGECDGDFHVDMEVTAGIYFVELIDTMGCIAHGLHTVSEVEVITGFTVTPACTGTETGEINLTAAGANPPYEYLWSNNEETEDIENLAAGTYTVTVMDQRGCTAINMTEVGVEDIALDFNAAETCTEQNAGAIITTVTNGSSNYDLTWTGAGTSGTQNDNASDVITVSDLNVGSYDITVTDSRGCTATGSTVVNVYAMSVDMVSGDACAGQDNGFVGATPVSGIPDYTFNWSNNSVEGVISDLAPGTYTVTITDINGCTAEDQTTISEYELIPSFTVSNVCSGGNTGAIVVDVENGTGNIDYQWSNNQAGNPLGNIGTGTYTVTITDELGCSVTGSAEVNEFDSPTAVATGDATIQLGESTEVSVDASGGTAPYTYNWIPAFVANPTAATTQATPNTTTTFTAEVTDANGCIASDTVLIIVVPPVIVSVPNAFSPNGDTKNDIFEYFVPNMDAEIQTFQVFDRWGKLLHDDPTAGWDGIYKGKEQPVGTYVYVLEYFDALNRKATLKGHFSLIR